MKKPKNWNEISVNQFIELKDVDNEVTIISIILDVSEDDLYEMDFKKFLKLVNELEFVSSPLSMTNHSTDFQFNNEHYHLIDLYKMTIGEFIDLENYFKEEYIFNLPKIISILYRKKIDGKIEPYDNWVEEDAIAMGELGVGYVFGVIAKYLEFRRLIYSSYEGLFNMSDDEDIEDEFEIEEDSDSPNEEVENKNAKWGWDALLYKLANENPLKIEEATNLPLIQALNTLSMIKELSL